MPAYKDQKTGKWFAKFRYKDLGGNQKNVTKRGFWTKKEALEWEYAFKKKMTGSMDMLFEDFAEVYLEDIRPRIKLSTFEMKKCILWKKIVPFFRGMKVCEITTRDIMRWQNEMLEYKETETGASYTKGYLKTLHNQLNAILNHAVHFYNLSENPASKAGQIGKKNEMSMKFWTREQYQKFSDAMMDYPMDYYCYEVLYWTGIREGELLALTVGDFDFEKKTVTINKTYHRFHGQEIITEPKTEKSNRIVEMPDFLCEEIQEYFLMCQVENSLQRAFPTTKNHLNYMIHKGAEMAKLPHVRVHDLRHSHVSLLINMGFSALAIAERVGHESIDITYRYAHLFPSVQTEMANRLNEMKEVC